MNNLCRGKGPPNFSSVKPQKYPQSFRRRSTIGTATRRIVECCNSYGRRRGHAELKTVSPSCLMPGKPTTKSFGSRSFDKTLRAEH